jgi:hypothetical protein
VSFNPPSPPNISSRLHPSPQFIANTQHLPPSSPLTTPSYAHTRYLTTILDCFFRPIPLLRSSSSESLLSVELRELVLFPCVAFFSSLLLLSYRCSPLFPPELSPHYHITTLLLLSRNGLLTFLPLRFVVLLCFAPPLPPSSSSSYSLVLTVFFLKLQIFIRSLFNSITMFRSRRRSSILLHRFHRYQRAIKCQ